MLGEQEGLYVRKEIHARDFVAGRGKVGPKDIGKWKRSRIFYGLLQLVARLPGVMLINVCLDRPKTKDAQLEAWDRLVNRIERTMKALDDREANLRTMLIGKVKSALAPLDAEAVAHRLNAFAARAILISDEGHEHEITRALRKMRAHNPIPSKYGAWSPGEFSRNITTERILEDPFFRDSERSYFLQLVDCVAFALLKREVPPTPNVKKYGIHEMFDQTLTGICFKKASSADPIGIVRR